MKTLIALQAAEQAAAMRLKKLTDARNDVQAAMEHANTITVSQLPAEDLKRLIFDRFHEHLAKALHSEFYLLIDEAQHNHWMAKLALEAFMEEAAISVSERSAA